MKEKMIKLRKQDLRKLVTGKLTLEGARRSGLIIETSPTQQMQQTDPTMYENDSVDIQIDKFLLQADPSAKSNTNESFLFEAEGDVPPPPTPADPNAGKPSLPTKRLDMMSFASDIARLVEKSDALLDIQGVIVRRALNYVTKNYDIKQAKDISQILENNFGITSDVNADSYEDESAPYAVGAGMPSAAQG